MVGDRISRPTREFVKKYWSTGKIGWELFERSGTKMMTYDAIVKMDSNSRVCGFYLILCKEMLV